ncbi:Mth938-like domain-containing protein [Desulforhopalus singaporensis]|uniref:Uncharacterized protein n=1 Tax=Desulforhopalus singaporensis TaxID=91360 RepID=A0A1H0LDL6_9BACT|nr:MTH938/NDUFAF3 family protein [Desulforhopalus singaporensis]SDO66182.1 hypothetical protein SAMN05660330_00761 [Desulforhopalus singaporensis]
MANGEAGVKTSPRILSYGWGKMEIEGLGRGKDFKLWPGGGRPWDWSEYGTGHRAGVQPGDIEELIDSGCTTIILTTGRMRRLRVPREIVDQLEDRNIKAIVADTRKGISTYNEYVARGERVGGLFHSTC